MNDVDLASPRASSSPPSQVMRWGCLVSMAVVLGTLGPCGYAIVRDTVINNRHLSRMARAMQALKHPDGTARIRFESRVGLLVGCGNHNDFFVGELRTYSGDRERITEFYKGVAIHNPVGKFDQQVELVFPEPDGEFKAWLPDCFDRLAAWRISPQERGGHVYLVFVFSSFPPDMDLRGH